MSMSKNHDSCEVQSPCVRNCCLDDNDICVGCYRSLQEITHWSAMSSTEKLLVLDFAADRKKMATSKRPSF